MTQYHTNIIIAVAPAFVARLKSPISNDVLEAFGTTMDEALQNLQLKLWKDATNHGIEIERDGEIDFIGYTDRDFFERSGQKNEDRSRDDSNVGFNWQIEREER